MGNKEFDIDITTNIKERIISKARYESFSKYCYWLLRANADGEELFYTRDLMKFAKINYSVAYRFFSDLVYLGMMKQEKAGNFNHFTLIRNDGQAKLKKFLPYFIKTLKEADNKKAGKNDN